MSILTNALLDNQIQSPDCISGQIGGSISYPSSPQVLKFDEYWVTGRGITYDGGTGRFTVARDGIYHITGNFFKRNTSGATRVMVGINTDTPTKDTHYGHAYSNATDAYQMMPIDTIVSLSAGDYITFYLESGTLYNQANDRFNQFNIQWIGT